MADRVAEKVEIYDNYHRPLEGSLVPKHTENQSPPTMHQEMSSSSISSTNAVKSTQHIDAEVEKEIENTRKLNIEKEELWAKFAKNTEVKVVTRIESLSSIEICELSKWIREKAKPQITSLSISKSDIDDKAAKALAKAIKPQSTIDKLTTLKFGNKLSKLETLELEGDTISNEGIATLAKVIQTNHTITNFKLTGSNISDEGIGALVELIAANDTLKNVDFKDNGFTEQQKRRFEEALSNNRNTKIENFWYS